MKSIGITRRVDDLGRIVLPMEIRKHLGLEEGTSIEIFVQRDEIILKKFIPKRCECGQRVEDEDKYCRRCGKKV